MTVGGDKGYDTRGFVETLRDLEVTPHVALKKKSRTLDRRTTRHAGYAISQCARKRIEEVFGWMKTVGGLRKLRHRGGARVNWQFLFAAAAYNLVRMRTLETSADPNAPVITARSIDDTSRTLNRARKSS